MMSRRAIFANQKLSVVGAFGLCELTDWEMYYSSNVLQRKLCICQELMLNMERIHMQMGNTFMQTLMVKRTKQLRTLP